MTRPRCGTDQHVGQSPQRTLRREGLGGPCSNVQNRVATGRPPRVGGSLRPAAEVLSSASVTVAAEKPGAGGLLNPAGPVTPIGPDNVLLRRKRNPLLGAIRLGAVRATLSPAAQLVFDCGNRHPRYLIRQNDDRAWHLRPEHQTGLPDIDPAWVPQVLRRGTVWPHADDGNVLGAAAQALALTKIGDVRPWALFALDLGLPKYVAVAVTRYWRRIIADDPRRLVRALTRAGANSHALGREEFHHVVRRY